MTEKYVVDLVTLNFFINFLCLNFRLTMDKALFKVVQRLNVPQAYILIFFSNIFNIFFFFIFTFLMYSNNTFTKRKNIFFIVFYK